MIDAKAYVSRKAKDMRWSWKQSGLKLSKCVSVFSPFHT